MMGMELFLQRDIANEQGVSSSIRSVRGHMACGKWEEPEPGGRTRDDGQLGRGVEIDAGDVKLEHSRAFAIESDLNSGGLRRAHQALGLGAIANEHRIARADRRFVGAEALWLFCRPIRPSQTSRPGGT